MPLVFIVSAQRESLQKDDVVKRKKTEVILNLPPLHDSAVDILVFLLLRISFLLLK